MRLPKLLTTVVLAGLLAFAVPARATHYQDMWWNPTESGWGLNLTQQGDTIFAIWFVYDAARRGTWFVASCPLVNDRTCSGPLYATTGPAFSRVPFDPGQVTETAVGTANFEFYDLGRGRLVWTANGVTVTKEIFRYSYAAPPIGGTYWVSGAGRAVNCGSNPDYRYQLDNAGLVLGSDGSNLSFKYQFYAGETWDLSYSCSASGPFVQRGALIAFYGPFACSDGSSGNLDVQGLAIDARGLVGSLQWNYSDFCVETENIGGVRHPAAGSPGTLALGAAAYPVTEGPLSVLVTVTRTGGSRGAVAVNYATVDGTARAGQDYTAVSGTLTWADGDAGARTFVVSLLDDGTAEGSETFTVVLSSPTGGATLGSPATATVTITDNDSGDTGSVGPGGGTVSKGGLVITVPPGTFGATTPVGIAPTTPDTSYTPAATVLSDAFTVSIGDRTSQPITLSAAAKGAPAAGDTVLAVLIDNNSVGMYDATPRKGVRLVEATYVNGRYEVTLPAHGATAKALRQKASSSFTFTIYIIGGYMMKSSTHFNIRFPIRTCNSLMMSEWLDHAEEAWTLLVDRMKFDPSGLGISLKRMSIDVVDLSSSGTDVSGGLSYDPWTLGIFDNLNLQFRLPTAKCSTATPAQARDMEATIGHEFFHAIQNVYDPAPALIEAIWSSRGLCLYDASSSWFEGEMLGDKSYVGGPTASAATTFYREGLGRGCKADPQQFGYGMATFLRFLTEKFGSELVQALWTQVRNGAGYDVPVDVMTKSGVRVADEWTVFAQKLLLGTGGLGWPMPPSDGTASYQEGSLVKFSATTPQLSSRKYLIDFRSLSGATNKSPTCTMRVTTGAGQHNAILYKGTTAAGFATLIDSFKTTNPQFTPTASNDYVLIVTNVHDTALVVDGVRYGQQSPFEVTIDCGTTAPVCANGNWEVSLSVPSSMEASHSCKLDSTQQTATLCLTAVNGVVSARGSTCYSRLQSATGTINPDGSYSIDYKWGAYGTGSLVDGSGDSGAIASGRITGRFTGGCTINGTAAGEYHAWSKSSMFCSNGYDLKQTYQSPATSK